MSAQDIYTLNQTLVPQTQTSRVGYESVVVIQLNPFHLAENISVT